MKIKKNSVFFLVLGTVIFAAYLLFAGKSLHNELQLIPEWTISVDSVSAREPVPGTIMPFKLGKKTGYFSSGGAVVSVRDVPDRSAVSSFYTADYTSDSRSVEVFRRDGEKQCTIEGNGFPFFSDDRIFMFFAGGNIVAQYDSAGTKLWQYEYYVPLICFSSSPAGIAAGFADGSLHCFDRDGNTSFSMMPGGSDYQIVFGTDISDSGAYVASVSGINRQRFVLLKVTGNRYKTVFHEYLDGNVTDRTFVQFNRDESSVYFNYSGGLGIADCRNLSVVHIPLDGKVLAVEEIPAAGSTFVLCRNGSTYQVYIIENKEILSGSFSFEAEYAFISVSGDHLFVGKDDTVSSLKINRR